MRTPGIAQKDTVCGGGLRKGVNLREHLLKLRASILQQGSKLGIAFSELLYLATLLAKFLGMSGIVHKTHPSAQQPTISVKGFTFGRGAAGGVA